jgi:uncharacterized protein YbcI
MDVDWGKARAEIANGILFIHREQYGRGAKRARTIIQGDYVACFMDDIYTPAERTLITAGRFEQVREARTAFQDVLRESFTKVVEDAIGRRVIAFFSQVNANPGMGVEAFVLEPQATRDGGANVGESSLPESAETL